MTATALILLSVLATCYGQLVYPDDYNLLRASTAPPVYYSTINQATYRPSANRNAPLPYAGPPQFSRPLALPEAAPVGTAATTTLRPPAAFVDSTPTRVSENALQNWSHHVNDIIVDGVLKFALDMEREIDKTRSRSLMNQRDNIVFSPISLAMTLAIVLAGSAGRTFQEVSKVLGLESGVDISRNSEIVHQMFGLLLTQLRRKIIDSSGPRIDLATATYVQDGYPILQQFESLSKNVYDNDVIGVDFARNGKAAQDMINAWVKEKTMGKISSILNDVPDPATSVILLSALYFNGEWEQHFLDGATRRKQFFIEPEEAVDVDMMYNGGTFPYYEDRQLGVKIIGLPYKGREISMYVMLPTANGAKALREFQNRLTVNIIENLIRNMKNSTCIIGLPRMKLSSSLSLKSTLANLGLNSLFNPSMADLSLMSQANAVNNGHFVPEPVMANPTVMVPTSHPGKSNTVPLNPQSNTEDVLIFTRIDDNDKGGHMVRRDYFAYEDKVRGYAVQQWSTGFSIKRTRTRRDARGTEKSQKGENRTMYTLEEKPETNENTAKVVNLEGNKYHFQPKEQRRRNRRQGRPIDEDFLKFVRQRNFPSYGLDELRNNAKLLNPRLYASDVIHKVEIDITEKGTEAAAATGIILERDGNQKKFIANRPFIFFIRHDPTRLVLFWGTLNVPTPKYPAT